MATRSKPGSSIQRPKSPSLKFPYYRADLAGVADAGRGYRKHDYIYTNMPATLSPWLGRITAVDANGGLVAVVQMIPGALENAPAVATFPAKSWKGKTGTLTFSFNLVTP